MSLLPSYDNTLYTIFQLPRKAHSVLSRSLPELARKLMPIPKNYDTSVPALCHRRFSMSDNRQLPILLVDDNERFLEIEKTLLHSKGFGNVTTLSDSRSVLQQLERKEFAVLVLDLMMPGICGDKLLQMVVEQ